MLTFAVLILATLVIYNLYRIKILKGTLDRYEEEDAERHRKKFNLH